MEKQFVSTCYITYQNKFLLHFHKKHGKWLPPGGHIEENETPPEAAKREACEETGLEIEFIHQENLWVDEWNSKSIERPFACLLEEIPARKGEMSHQHIDFIFVAKPIGGHLIDGKWFTLEEVEALKTHEEIFFDTQEMIRQILHNFPSGSHEETNYHLNNEKSSNLRLESKTGWI